MKKIYIMYSERHGEFEGVFSESGEILGGWYLDTACWQNEYFSGFMEKLGIDCLTINPESKPFWYRRLCRYLNIDFRMY